MTIHEASKQYCIPIKILQEYESWGLCGAVKALFLEHEGYCGAVGALLSTLKNTEFNVIPNSTIDDDDKNSVDVDPMASVEEIRDFIWEDRGDQVV